MPLVAGLSGRSQDDAQLHEALTCFHLQLFGDPAPLAPMSDARDALELSRRRYLESHHRAQDGPALHGFLADFVRTQMFEVFSACRRPSGELVAEQAELASLPFFQASLFLCHMRQAFDRVR